MAHTFLPDPEAISLEAIEIAQGIVLFHVHTTAQRAVCPECGATSDRVHSRYSRTIQDLTWQGNPVQFKIRLRKFFCDTKSCSKRIFAQCLPKIARRYQRKTTRLETVLKQILWEVGASAAATIAKLLGLLLSHDAILYQFNNAPQPCTAQTSPRELGIDDFAFRKGKTYGTILIDLKTSTPVDLLPDREKVTVEKWLREHPGAKIVSRDRSAVYAEAIREGAPEATSVADRFHLVKNLMETLQEQMSKESKAIREVLLPQVPSMVDDGPVCLTRRQKQARAQSRQNRFERWQQVHALFKEGYAKKEIARMMNLDSQTVRNYLMAETFQERQRTSPANGPLTPFKDYLLKRWQEGCQNAYQLWREVKDQGFVGGAAAVRDFVRPLRDPDMAPAPKRAERSVPSTRALTWLLILPERGTPEQTSMMETLCTALPILPQCRELVVSFKDIMARRASKELEGWLEKAKDTGLPSFVSFVRGIRMDLAAVEAAFSLPWSNGPVEGHVNRLKFIKRQGYGRASFELLRRRVLPLPNPT